MDISSIFKKSLTGSTSVFLPNAIKPGLPNNLTITGGSIIRIIPFPKVLVLCEMQSTSSRI